MSKLLLDYDPLSGQRVYLQTQDHENTFRIVHESDPTPSLEYAHARRVDDDYTKKGIKNDFWHYAKLPAEVVMQMATEDGVNILKPGYDKKRFFKLLNTKYARFKTTDKTHNVR